MKLKSSDKNSLFQVKRENTEKVALKLGNVTIKTKNFRLYGPFLCMGSTISTGFTELQQGGSLLFTTKTP